MTGVILIDSDVLIWLTRGQQSAKARLSKINPWRISAITYMEPRRPLTSAQAPTFVTTDDRLIKKMREAGGLPVMLPGEALAFLENWYEN